MGSEMCIRDRYGAWPIGIETLPGYAEPKMLALRNCAIATSGIDKRTWTQHGGVRAHHIIDPRTGVPSQSDIVRASVIAPTLLEADVAARTLVILGTQQGMDWLASQANHACLVHCADGTTLTDDRWHAYLWEAPSA